MKSFIVILIGVSLLSFNTFADTPSADEADTGPSVEKAEELYRQRGEDVEKARQAAEMYKELAAQKTTTEDKAAKAQLVLKQVESMYYVAGQLKDQDAFEENVKLADSIVQLLAEPESSEEEEEKASALFWYGASLGQAMALASNAGRRKKVITAMNDIIDMGYEDLHSYGANRVLGRLYFKLPGFMGGSYKKSRKNLKNAFENTLVSDEVKVSVHGLNNLYYAELLKGVKEGEQACQVLQTFVEQDPETLMEERIPETAEEIETAKEMLKSFKCPQATKEPEEG